MKLFKRIKDRRINRWKNHLKKAEKHFGVKAKKVIGTGGSGVAFKVKGGKVLKLTTDTDEYQNSKKLIGRHTNRITKIHGVLEITKKEHFFNGMYAILMDRVKPLNKKEKKIVKMFDSLMSGYKGRYLWSWSALAKRGKDQEIISKINKKISNKSHEMINLYVSIIRIHEEAHRHGIEMSDMHEGNIGWKDGIIVGFDIT